MSFQADATLFYLSVSHHVVSFGWFTAVNIFNDNVTNKYYLVCVFEAMIPDVSFSLLPKVWQQR